MFKKVIFLTAAIVLCFNTIEAAPSKVKADESPPETPPQSHTNSAGIEDIQLIHPHIITIERFESLLRRAGEIFRPGLTTAAQLVDAIPFAIQSSGGVPVPYQHIQPPTEQPFNFYLPLFEPDEHAQLDAKSRSMEHIVPPPFPNKGQEETNYYAVKPKKHPKKFNVEDKHINVKWLNAFEKEALRDGGGEMPRAVYLVNDERNRINFDDSFFGVDMQVKVVDNEPHKDQKHAGADHTQPEEFYNEGEEDLLATSGSHAPYKYAYGSAKRI